MTIEFIYKQINSYLMYRKTMKSMSHAEVFVLAVIGHSVQVAVVV